MENSVILHVWENMEELNSVSQKNESLYSQSLKERLFMGDQIQIRTEGDAENKYTATVKLVTYDSYSGILFIDAVKNAT